MTYCSIVKFCINLSRFRIFSDLYSTRRIIMSDLVKVCLFVFDRQIIIIRYTQHNLDGLSHCDELAQRFMYVHISNSLVFTNFNNGGWLAASLFRPYAAARLTRYSNLKCIFY